MAFIIKRQQDNGAIWLVSVTPQSWGERDQAMRFDTRNDAQRAANVMKLSGDWSIDIAPLPLVGPAELSKRQ
jgi:hypothetical protein